MELRSASIWCFQKSVKTPKIIKNTTKQSFLKEVCRFSKKETPAAACKAVSGAWGVPIHIKMPSILINMPFILINIYDYTLLVLLISIILIAHWLPIAYCLLYVLKASILIRRVTIIFLHFTGGCRHWLEDHDVVCTMSMCLCMNGGWIGNE